MFDQKYDLISRQNYLADNQLTQDTDGTSCRNAVPGTNPYRKSIIASKKLIKKRNIHINEYSFPSIYLIS